ncbi:MULTISPECIES: hypothetical protein [Paenibacillus]|uniref:XRE family transcriptional regulator n=1 Tax=Paenibacillus peoriae TaxID=59893 RepID=A0A7H0Y2N2_9BACL|nr:MULTISPECIES: hypothetical protein [Paenibacillus]MDN4106428.1 hypothetical protein [Paenibacillus polymyxa]QNR65340.1 hypothetical protein IAQ67_15700 [Paenibacillus peoriae]
MEIKVDAEHQIGNIVKMMLASRGRSSIKGLADEIGMHENTFRSALNKGSLRLKDFVRIADVLGFNLSIKDGEERK